MSSEQDRERTRLAYRRAGLAVAHHAQGRAPRPLSLQPAADDEAGGRRWPVDLGSAARHRLELEILAQWAGLLSEARACWDGGAPPEGWGRALEPLADLGRRVTRSDGENEAYLEWLRHRAGGLLELPGTWPAVEALAEALLEKGSLGGADATALIAGIQRSRRRTRGLGGFFRDGR
jgi:hypothetical protein